MENLREPHISKFAKWSLVCACLSLICGIFGAIPAIILGHKGLFEIKTNPAMQGREMAIAGLIIGYSMLIFLLLLAAFFLTVFPKLMDQMD